MGFISKIFPNKLWTKSFTFWWLISLASILLFDLFWMFQTTFRAFGYLPFWPILFLNATIMTLPSLFSRNGIWNLFVLLIADTLFISNLMYCNTYYNAIPLQSYFIAGNLSDFGASVADSFRWYYVFLPILSLLAFIIYSLLKFRNCIKPSLLPYSGLILVLFLLTWVADLPFGGSFARIGMMKDNAYEASSVSTVYSIPGFLAYDLHKSTMGITQKEEKEVGEWLKFHRQLTEKLSEDSTCQNFQNRKNLILILCESLESWPIGKIVEGKEITPELNRLIADSATFFAPNVVSQVGPGRSIDGQLLILAGMLPMKNNVYAYETEGNQFYTLPKALKMRGTHSYLISCDKPYVWNQTRVARAFGIDTLIQAADFYNDEPVGGHKRLSDGGLMKQSIEKMRKGELWPEGEPGFLIWVTYSGHNPFKLPDKLRRISFEGDYPEIIRNYMTTANYTDHAIGMLIDYLRSRSDWEETMVVITGDHEGLASYRNEAIQNPATANIVDPGQHTPLIIINSPLAERYEGEMGEVDIYSTLLDLMKLSDYEWKGMGLSVVNPGFPGVAIGSTGNIEGNINEVPAEILDHLVKARDISDIILRFDLLKENEYVNE